MQSKEGQSIGLIIAAVVVFTSVLTEASNSSTMASSDNPDFTPNRPSNVPQAYDKSHPVKADTEYGSIEGFVHSSSDGTKANIFLGVPFAQPPVGELRFERPVPPHSWSETLECKNFRDSCVPYIKQWIQNPTFSEDCLYLNVMAPAEKPSDPAGYPVLVYIHGGGFCFGDVVKGGFDKITKNFVSRGLVVVTMPYRVGLYGFMSLGTKEDPGNIGLWDQVAALKFIKQNIKNFGGNDENITLWGQSAGSASVDLMAMSPHSRDLFHKVIQASGTALNSWASSAPVIKITKQIARFLGCESDSPSEIKAFLKKQTYEDILDICSTKFQAEDKNSDVYLGFSPRYDDDFFDGKTMEQLIEEAPPKPTIMGLMTLEGGPFLLFGINPEKLKTYSGEDIIEAVRTKYFTEKLAGKDAKGIQDDVIDYYVNREAPSEPNPGFYIQRHGELVSDVMFGAEVLKEADLKTKLGWPVYFYYWNHMSDAMKAVMPLTKGSWHSYELSYCFDQITYPMEKKGETEAKIQNYYADFFANFVKTGNPNNEKIPFPRYTLDKKEALWIDPELSTVSRHFEDVQEFWDGLVEKYDYNPLRHRTKEELTNRFTD